MLHDQKNGSGVSRRDALRAIGAAGLLLSCEGPMSGRRTVATASTSRPKDRIGEFLAEHMETFGMPGLSALVVRGDDARTYALGQNDIDFDVPVTVDTPFQIASVSKIFAGIALMLLVDDGTLNVDARLSDVLDDTPSAWRDIRVHQLLEHTSGLPRTDAGAPGFEAEDQRRRRRELFVDAAKLDRFTGAERLEFLASQPLVSVPGAIYSYNQMGYVIAGLVVESLTGSTYPSFLADRVFQPLDMRTARFGDSRVLVPGRRQAAYTRQYGPFQNWLWPYATSDYPAAGLNISAPDLGKCVAALSDGRLLSDESRDRMWTRLRLAGDTRVDYGLGWEVRELDGETVVGHEGGGCSWLTHAPRLGVTAIVLSNLAGSGADDTADRVALLAMADR